MSDGRLDMKPDVAPDGRGSASYASATFSARVGETWLLALASALLAGWLHAGVLAFRRHILQTLTWSGGDYAWTTPLGYVILFSIVAVPLSLLAGALRRRLSSRIVAWLFAFSAALSVLLLFQRISQWAAIVLAAGMAVPLSELASRPPAGAHRVLRRTVAALCAAIFVAFALVRGGAAWAERRGLAAHAAPDDAPNVLLLVLDTVGSADLSLYGYDRPTTPVLDGLSRESVVFDAAFSTSPWTFPSHASMFTGRFRYELDLGWRSAMRDEHRTLAESLRDAGYATGGFVANAWYTGSETGLNRGFLRYRGYRKSVQQMLLGTTLARSPFARHIWNNRSLAGVAWAVRHFSLRDDPIPPFDRKEARVVSQDFLEWQAGLGDRPFFAFLNYYDAHDPYTAPPGYVQRFAATSSARDRYDAAISYIDHEIGDLLRQLQRRGVLDRTMIIVTADHGELFGEHGMNGHGNSVWQPVLRVPLLVRLPQRAHAGTRVAASVSLRDLAATVLDVTGRRDAERAIPGASLLALLDGRDGPVGSPVIAEFEGNPNLLFDGKRPNAQVTLIRSGFQFVEWDDGRDMLLGVVPPRMPEPDLTHDPKFADTLRVLRDEAHAMIEGWNPGGN